MLAQGGTPDVTGGGGGSTNPVLALTSSSSPSTYGNAVTFTVAITPATCTSNADYVTFYNGSASIGTAYFSGNKAQLTISSLTAGSQTISGSYPGYSTSTITCNAENSNAIIQTVNPATPTISISDIPSSAIYGGSFTPAYSYSGNGSPTKSVSSSTTSVCTVSGNTVSYVGVGTCTLKASATATTDYTAATGSAQSFTVSQATPTISISDIPSSAKYGGSFTVSYSYSGNGSPTESVSSSTTSVCSVSGSTVRYVGVGTCTLTSSATATADYKAASGSAQSFTVSQAPSTISISDIPSSAKYGASFTVSYSYSGNGSPAVSSSTMSVCSVSGSTVNYVGVGTCTLTASATATADYAAATGSAQSFTVSKATPTGSISCSPNPVTYQSGATQTATCTASMAGVSGGATPTGTVSIYWNGNAWASPTLSSGSASLTGFNGLGAGSYSITGSYSGDGNYIAVSLSSTTEKIQQATPKVSVWPTAGAINYGQTLAYSTLVGGTASVDGTFAWTTSSAVPALGTSSEGVTFTPTDSTDYSTVSGSINVTVGPALTVAIVYTYSATYDGVGNVSSYSDSTYNGGSIMGAWNMATGSGTSGYDSLNRLVAAQAASGSYAGQYLCYAYDSFGNRTAQYQQNTACPAQETSLAPTDTYSVNNQVTWVQNSAPSGFQYDVAGNVIEDNLNKYFYDSDGHICEVQNLLVGSMTGYLYDAEGNRVAKGEVTIMGSCDPASNGFTLTESYVLGQGGQELSMFNGSGQWQRSNVFGASKQLATFDTLGLHYQITDPLGTRRMQVSSVGQPETDIQSLPYGDQLNSYSDPLAPATADDATPLHFTGKERDTESGNDYFGARYYASSMGRFLSPDWASNPEAVPYGIYTNPQTLNLYNYMRNNPLSGVDKDGHCGGPNDPCSDIAVTAKVTQQPTMQKNVQETVNGKPVQLTGPSGQLTFQVTSKGAPLPGVGVTEQNQKTVTIDGKQTPAGPTVEGTATSNNEGKWGDVVGRMSVTDGSSKQNDAIVGAYSTNTVSVTDKQTLTLTLPGGAGTCSATDTRTLTNVGPGGTPSGTYTITPTNPTVTVTPPPVKPPNQ
ncbi:MAG: Ig-like domain repeat protein [Terracidiphilus sp.]